MRVLYEVKSNGCTVDITPEIGEAQRLFYKTHGRATLYVIKGQIKQAIVHRESRGSKVMHINDACAWNIRSH